MNLLKTKTYICNWLTKYANNNNKIFIVGISGGIDSALTSTLCAETEIKTIIVSMPIKQNKDQLVRAQEHAKWLETKYKNVEKLEINLDYLFNAFQKTMPQKIQNEIGLINTKARLRMTTLYQIASAQNGIVVGTGNKIEDFGVGFFTKYGDGGVDISPIADLTKTEVKKIALNLNIIESIIKADPTDGLWENNRTDEDQLGAKYSELEWAMHYRENNMHGKENLSKKEIKILSIYDDNHKKNKHKMTTIPICKIPENLKNE